MPWAALSYRQHRSSFVWEKEQVNTKGISLGKMLRCPAGKGHTLTPKFCSIPSHWLQWELGTFPGAIPGLSIWAWWVSIGGYLEPHSVTDFSFKTWLSSNLSTKKKERFPTHISCLVLIRKGAIIILDRLMSGSEVLTFEKYSLPVKNTVLFYSFGHWVSQRCLGPVLPMLRRLESWDIQGERDGCGWPLRELAPSS